MDIPGLLKHPKLARIVGVCDVDSQRIGWAKGQHEMFTIIGQDPYAASAIWSANWM